jgi:hypothetical protein
MSTEGLPPAFPGSPPGPPPRRTFRQLLLSGAFLAGLLNLAAVFYDQGTDS